MKDAFLKVLNDGFRVEYDEHRLALEILMEKCVGISDHTNFIEEAKKHTSAMASASEQQEIITRLIEE